MDQKAWIEKPTLRLDDLGRRVAAVRVAAGLRGEIDTHVFNEFQRDWRGK